MSFTCWYFWNCWNYISKVVAVPEGFLRDTQLWKFYYLHSSIFRKYQTKHHSWNQHWNPIGKASIFNTVIQNIRNNECLFLVNEVLEDASYSCFWLLIKSVGGSACIEYRPLVFKYYVYFEHRIGIGHWLGFPHLVTI